MVNIEYLLDWIPAIGVTIALIYYTQVLRNQERTRQRDQLHLRIQSADIPYSRAWTNVLFKNASTREEWREIYHPVKDPVLFADMIFIQNRFQSLGIMLKDKIIDPDLLYRIYQPNSILVTWEHYRPNILARREEINDPNILSDFEYLYNETVKRFPDIDPRTRDDLD
jgi:hypothetical protein